MYLSDVILVSTGLIPSSNYSKDLKYERNQVENKDM